MLIHLIYICIRHDTADGRRWRSKLWSNWSNTRGHSVSLDGHTKLHVSHVCVQKLLCFLSAEPLASEELYWWRGWRRYGGGRCVNERSEGVLPLRGCIHEAFSATGESQPHTAPTIWIRFNKSAKTCSAWRFKVWSGKNIWIFMTIKYHMLSYYIILYI